jgi:magnesium-transporting ATPase (P-type)
MPAVASPPTTPVADAFARPADEVLLALATSESGLTAADAAARIEHYGPNRLPDPPRDPAWKRFARHFDDVLIYILLAAALLKALLGEWVDFGVILAVAVINAIIGFVQEGRAENALAGIRTMLSAEAHVRRDEEWRRIPAEDLVPGDIVRVTAGDRVPADIRLTNARNLRVEEAALTGESVPAEKGTDPVQADAGIGDRESMLFSSSIVSAGSGQGVVTGTGADAEIGRITTMLAEVEDFDTPLTKQMKGFGRALAYIILVMAIIMVAIGRLVHQLPLDELVAATIGFAIAAIPEGLPALVTITLALGVRQMARQRAITRKLPAVETLGAVTTICSDKTGTLTTNEMTVRDVVTLAGHYHVTGLGYQPEGEIQRDGRGASIEQNGDLRSFITVMSVANDAELNLQDGGWKLVGEPTEGALRTLGHKAGFDHMTYPRVEVVPFDSGTKLMGTLNSTPGGNRVVLVKGAPDRLLARSASQLGEGGAPEPLDSGHWERAIDELSGQGLRVLAAAMRPAGRDQSQLELEDLTDLVFVGLAGIVDPPRPEAIRAIRTCHDAGIRVKMITGDHAGTALAISREMGIVGTGPATVITGDQLQAGTNTDLRHLVEQSDTFARTSPEHKLRLVKALQANGEVVAMTGDGVNDAPALKRADVGVAMGVKGTEATKEAAEVVLADDNFATLEYAVEEGRRIYDNLRKSVLFLLPTNGAQSLVILVAILLGWALPLAPVQILWVNLITAVTLALALAYEPAEGDLMHRPPRDPSTPLLAPRFVPRVALASVLIAAATLATFEIARGWDLPTDEAQTYAVNTLVLAQAAYLFNARFLRSSALRRDAIGGNPVAWIVVGVLIVLQVLFVYVPLLNSWFHSAPVDPRGWLLPLALAVVVFLLVEAVKFALRGLERAAGTAGPSALAGEVGGDAPAA